MEKLRWAKAFLAIGIPLFLGACGGGGGSGGVGGGTPTSTLSGVVSHNGAGFAGVTVTLSGAAHRSATTDASGAYSFPGLSAGAYTVTPSLVPAQSFDPPSRRIALDGDATAGFSLLDFSISGKATMNLANLPGVKVLLSGSSLSAVAASAVTDSGGAFTFSGLFNGAYTITPSYRMSPSGTPQTFSPSFSSHTLAGADLATPTFAMETWDLAGRLVWEGGDFTGGGTVVLTGDTDLLAAIGPTGGFRFPGLPDGTYTVRPLPALQTVSPAFTVRSVSGGALLGCDFALDTHTLGGTVTRSGLPYPGAQVALGGTRTGSTSSAGDGTYSFAGLLNGAYTVTPAVGGQTLTPSARSVAVVGGDSPGNDFSLDTLSLSGRVTLNGSGEPGATITLLGAFPGSATTGADGSWSIANLPAGSYTLIPSLAGQTLTPAWRRAMSSGAPVANLDFAVDTHAVSGRVTLNGASYGGTGSVEVTGADSLRTVPLVGGTYSVAGLQNGPYTVTPLVAGQTLRPAGRSLAVAGGDPEGIDFALETWAISGRVTLRGGPLRYVRIAATDGTAIFSASAGDTGEYSIPGLLNGDYLVAPDFPSQRFTPAVRPLTIDRASRAGADFGVPAVTWFVKPGTTTGDGLSWDRALIHPQDAVDIASSGDRVWVAGGTYTSPAPVSDAVPVVQMKAGVDLFGGFAGAELSLPARDPAANPTVLDGRLGTGGGVNHVVVGASRAALDGFTVTNGDGTDYEYGGAGMIIRGQLGWEVKNCVFDSNLVTWNGSNGAFGGGLYCQNSSGVVQSCTFTRNRVTGWAGGWWGGGSNYPPYGGAVASFNTLSLSIAGCVFDDNRFEGSSGSGRGGAVFTNGNGPVTITGCDFTGNGLVRASEGGALTIWNNPAQVLDCRFLGNGTPGSSNGGAIQVSSPSWKVGSSLFTGNAGGSGSALFSANSGADAWVGNSLFFGNHASGGSYGAINCQNSPVQVMNCTVAGNTASSTTATGGLFIAAPSAAARPVLTNTILWGNTNAQYAGTVPVAAWSDLMGWTGGGTGNIAADPLFADAASGDFHPAAGSPCIDAGSNATVPGWMITYDLDGLPRTRDGDRDGGPNFCDMGCYEVQP